MSWSVLGLMSGTSLDGIDAAILETDGITIKSFGPSLHHAYSAAQRRILREAIASSAADIRARAAREITAAHLAIIHAILAMHQTKIDLIGFHGQTIAHAPATHALDQGITLQIGDGAEIARQTQIDVVGDFRSQDVAAGGQGAPLAPLYHRALVEKTRLRPPVAIVNIGGVANMTFIGKDDLLLAFDTGPGNGLMDQWAAKHIGTFYDEDGRLAAKGQPNKAALTGYLASPFFKRPPPKSLDRYDFTLDRVAGLSAENGAATLLALTARTIASAADHLPHRPAHWILCGGGRHNRALRAQLEELIPEPVSTAEKMGWQGDMIEAQAFAYLAARAVQNLPLTLPSTTGVAQPLTGGRLFKA